jgi:DNA primase
MKVDFEAIKAATDIVGVIASYGVKLKRAGQDFVGLCPFHQEKAASFHVTPAKGLFHCFGCHAKGNVIQFVALKEGVREREAAVKLLGRKPEVRGQKSEVRSQRSEDGSERPGEVTGLLQRVAGFYAKTLLKDRAGLDYLKRRNLADPAMLGAFQVGYSNGSLLKALPREGEIPESLKKLGVLKADGREHFQGCITVPIFDAGGNVSGIYGRRGEPTDDAPSAVGNPSPNHLYLPGPHRGVWNGACARTSPTLLVTEAIFDGLALWQAGFKNVIALYGARGWTPDHAALFKTNPIREVFLCLDNDEAGREGARELREKLLPDLVRGVHVVSWPAGVKDAAEFFTPARKPAEFEALLKAANPSTEQKSEQTLKLGEETVMMTPGGFVAEYAGRRYQCQAIEQASPARLKATVKVQEAGGRFHIDTVDFYLSRHRRVFISEASRLLRETTEVIEADVNRLIGQLEAYARQRAVEPSAAVTLVSEEDKAEGLKLGRCVALADEILRDVEQLGLVGEQTNKLMAYLVMTSRKMDDPLALMILSGSGAGKSLLQDTLLQLCPEEDLVKLTSLTDRALFYKGEHALKNKVLALEEVAGAEGAYYAIRNLISAKKLVIESTIKNPLTGQLTTQVNTVYGPTAVFQTTTRPDLDAETRSRFIITSIDESAEQTRAILEAQRHRHTLAGLRRKKQREAIFRRHHAFQRLLKPLPVVNPFEPLLSYAEDRLAVRRDNPKYLNLVLAVTFLHQFQRPLKHDADSGLDYLETTLDDIAIANDLATALFGQSLDDLSRPSRELLKLIRRMVDELRRKTGAPDGKRAGGGPLPGSLGGQPYRTPHSPSPRPSPRGEGDPAIMGGGITGSGGASTFNRRAVREFTGWSDYQVKIHIKALEELEYLVPLTGRRGQTFCYKLAWEGEGLDGERFLPGLIQVEELRRKAEALGLEAAGEQSKLGGPKTQVGGPKTKLEGARRVQVGPGRNGQTPHEQGPEPLSEPKLEGEAGGPVPVDGERKGS